MQAARGVSFGPYRLGGPHGPLERRSQEVKLPPKALAVLWRLVTHAGQVVTKEELLAAVWAGTVVGEEALTTCLRQVRRALGDDVKAPRYIATVHRVGYRFIGQVVSSQHSVVSSGKGSEVRSPASEVPNLAPNTQHSAPVLVGREAEFTHLHSLFVKALSGERQVVFVTGEAGIGKTALVEAFVSEVGGPTSQEANQKSNIDNQTSNITAPRPLPPEPWIAQGQCIEHYGAGEAYLPVLEALSRLCRQAEGEPIVRLLRRVAPSWLVQLPALLREEEYAALQRKVTGATRERMLREMAEALEAISAARPLVLVLEDVHWSDASTIDLLSMLARRREAARVLVLATSRQAELVVAHHPLKALKQELIAHRQATEILLGGLQVAAVQQYVGRRCAEQAEGAELAALVYRRTEGHPLFMVQMTEYLAQHHERGTAGPTALAALERELPQGLRDLIEEQVGRLTADEQRVLEAGSVAGAEFTVASVAAGVAVPADAIETVCEHLAQRGQFIEERELVRWPDGTLSGRYGFRHALYQEVVYQRLGASRRVRLHRQIGEREEVGYGERASEIAAELAMHFERGQDAHRAVHHHTAAAQQASRRYAHQEALSHITSGLAQLFPIPEHDVRAQRELVLQTLRGVSLANLQGNGTPEVEQAYTRAHELCRDATDIAILFPVLWGLWNFFMARGDFQRGTELADQMLVLAQRQPEPALLVQAHTIQGQTRSFSDDQVGAQTHCEQGLALYDVSQHRHLLAQYGEDPGVVCHDMLAQTRWLLGYPDQARRHVDEGRRLARELVYPFSLAQNRWRELVVLQWCGDVGRVADQAHVLIDLCRAETIPMWLAGGVILQGWARACRERGQEGITLIRQGLNDWRTIGIELFRPYYLALLAEAYGMADQTEAGLSSLDEALQLVARTGERWWEAEVYRLTGELTLQQLQMKNVKLKMTRVKSKGPRQEAVVNPQGSVLSPQPPTPSTQAGAQEAEGYFLKAIEVARQQQAKSLELRAAVSLARLWRQQGKGIEAHRLLGDTYGWFTEGFDTTDLRDAKALLVELAE